MSNSSEPVMPAPAICSDSTGTEDALYTSTCGGVMPAGICLSTVCEAAVICACAVATSVPGWKKIFTMPRPYSDVLSMCSMLSTVAVSERS